MISCVFLFLICSKLYLTLSCLGACVAVPCILSASLRFVKEKKDDA
jgi:hypothetical protein